MDEISEDSQQKLNRINNIISNFRVYQEQGNLEKKLIHAYLHSSHFENIPCEDLKMIFDACDKERLKIISEEFYGTPVRAVGQNLNPFTVFRGCVGDDFRPGLSWTTDLYQAIKYPKRAKLSNFYKSSTHERCSVWVSLVERDEIYCYLNHYEPEFIVYPKKYWKVDIPQELFQP
jgi:hypothetical protein